MNRTTLLALLLCTTIVACKKDDDTTVAPVVSGTPCTYTVGNWSAWIDGVRTRTVTAAPAGCVGTVPATTENHPCVAANKGWLKVVNNSANPYDVTITGPTAVNDFTLPGGYQADSIYVGVGTYGLHSVQLSGYVLFPSEYNTTITLPRCNVVTWSFP
jgi:hypothetical protein